MLFQSQDYWAQGAEQAQQQITCSLVTAARSKRAFPSSSWPLLPALLLLPWREATGQKIWCGLWACFQLLFVSALSVGRRTLGHSGEAFLGVSCRAGRLSWQGVCQLCCGDLCCSLATEMWWHWVYRWQSVVATTDSCMNRFWSAKLNRRKTSKTSPLCFVFNFSPFIFFPLFCAICLYAISTCQWSDWMPLFCFLFSAG